MTLFQARWYQRSVLTERVRRVSLRSSSLYNSAGSGLLASKETRVSMTSEQALEEYNASMPFEASAIFDSSMGEFEHAVSGGGGVQNSVLFESELRLSCPMDLEASYTRPANHASTLIRIVSLVAH